MVDELIQSRLQRSIAARKLFIIVEVPVFVAESTLAVHLHHQPPKVTEFGRAAGKSLLQLLRAGQGEAAGSHAGGYVPKRVWKTPPSAGTSDKAAGHLARGCAQVPWLMSGGSNTTRR